MTKINQNTTLPWINGFLKNTPSLSGFARSQRWFRSKSKKIKTITVDDWASCEVQNQIYILTAIRFDFEDGDSELYFLPLAVFPGEVSEQKDQAVLSFMVESVRYYLLDAFQDKVFEKWLFEQCEKGSDFKTEQGLLKFSPRIHDLAMTTLDVSDIRNLKAEQSNTSIIARDAFILKIYRRLESGINPEVEILDFLRQHGYTDVPQLAADVTYQQAAGGQSSLGLMVDFIKGAADGWSFALSQLKSIYEKKASRENLIENLERVGELTGELHKALAMDGRDERFRPEIINSCDLERWTNAYDALLNRVLTVLKEKNDSEPEGRKAFRVIFDQEEYLRRAPAAQKVLCEKDVRKIRHHGDFHLGQILKSARGWILFDFEGEPLRSLEERKKKACPLKDVAGMLRSFSYAAHVSARDYTRERNLADQEIEEARDTIEKDMRYGFLKGYFDAVFEVKASGPVFLCPNREDNEALLSFYELDKAIYELNYELNNRPDWADVPLMGIQNLLNGGRE